MRVFCPSCNEPININDDQAGKTTVCPLCKATFNAPSLFGSDGSAADASSRAPSELAPYGLAPEPAAAPSPKPTSTFGVPAAGQTTPSPVSNVPQPQAPLPPLPPFPSTTAPRERAASEPPKGAETTGHARSIGFSISPEIIQWVAPVCLGIAVFLTFFSWNGAFPGGHAVYTQGPWRAMFGHIDTDPVGEKVLHMNPVKAPEGKTRLEDDVHMNLMMFVYLLLLLGTFALAVFFTLLPNLSIQVPPNIRQVEPWRMLIVAGLALFLLLILGLESARGFGLENALKERAAADNKEQIENPTEEDVKKSEIKEGQFLGSLNVRHTLALDLEFWMLLVAAVGAAATFVINRRTDRPTPRVEFRW
jgi:hypothetical protein